MNNSSQRAPSLPLAPNTVAAETPAPTPAHAPVSTPTPVPDSDPATLSEQQALQALAEKSFIHDAAHQLRTPLAGIISQTELALKEHDPQQLHQRIRKIHAAAQRGAQLVKQMLALARSEADEPSHSVTEPYDIAQLAREVAREWIPKSLALHKDLGYEGAESAWVRGNRFMMREAISNLIDNALNYTAADGHITVRVQLAAAAQHATTSVAAAMPISPPASPSKSQPGHPHASSDVNDSPCPPPSGLHTVILEVADNGPGVAPEQLPHVFERFWRADDEHTSGSGLGLPLVERIATQHGGHATAYNAQPHGFIVRLHLPAADERQADACPNCPR